MFICNVVRISCCKFGKLINWSVKFAVVSSFKNNNNKFESYRIGNHILLLQTKYINKKSMNKFETNQNRRRVLRRTIVWLRSRAHTFQRCTKQGRESKRKLLLNLGTLPFSKIIWIFLCQKRGSLRNRIKWMSCKSESLKYVIETFVKTATVRF